MKIKISQLQTLRKKFNWECDKLAEQLSACGFESELTGDILTVDIPGSRRDIVTVNDLAKELEAIYGHGEIISHEDSYGLKIEVTLDWINQLLGTRLSFEQYRKLNRLGFKVNTHDVRAPKSRKDIKEPADVAEEVFRLWGVRAVDVKLLPSVPNMNSSDEYLQQLLLKQVLVGEGFTEVLTSSFTQTGERTLRNPFTADDLYLRPSLKAGLLKTLATNPFLKKARFFEIGNIFTPDEFTALGIIVAGEKNVTEITLKLERILHATVQLSLVEATELERFAVKQGKVYFVELKHDQWPPFNNSKLPTVNEIGSYKIISKFPPLVLDKTIVLSKSQTASDLGSEIWTIKQELTKLFSAELLAVEAIDRYDQPESNLTKITFKLFLQKYGSSFTSDEITKLNQKLDNYSFK